jgi:hypothetical protein
MFPFAFWGMSLWLTATAIILLVTTEFISPHYGNGNLAINKKKLRTVTAEVSIPFMTTLAIRLVNMILSS